VDEVEEIARKRACQLFGADHANVQPHSGANANLAAFFAFLKPGDTVLGMNLAHGGHLSHGSPVNISGTYFNVVPYSLNEETERLDYDEIRRIALEVKPKLIVAGASAYPREIRFDIFADIAREAGAYLMVGMAHIAGLVAAGLHMSPIPYADVVTTTTHKTLRGPRGGLILTNNEYLAKRLNSAVFPGVQGGPLEHVIAGKAVAAAEALDPSFKTYAERIVENCAAMADEFLSMGYDLVTGGTDNHLMLLDLTRQDVTGIQLQTALDACHITLNKNCVPRETRSPQVASGVRIGTAAMTTKGFDPDRFRRTARLIDRAVRALREGTFESAECAKIADEVRRLL
jgi:glycine hydroxymethyltransferase